MSQDSRDPDRLLAENHKTVLKLSNPRTSKGECFIQNLTIPLFLPGWYVEGRSLYGSESISRPFWRTVDAKVRGRQKLQSVTTYEIETFLFTMYVIFSY